MGELYNAQLLQADNMVNYLISAFDEVDTDKTRHLDIKKLEILLNKIKITYDGKTLDQLFNVIIHSCVI